MQTQATTDIHTAIRNKAQQIVDLLNSSEEMQRFRQAQDKINRHGDAQALLFVVRAKRNAYSQTSLRYGYEHPLTIQAKQEYDQVLAQIGEIPLIDEFKEAQEDLNDIVQGVLHTIVSTLHDTVPVEKSEEPGGSSGGCGNCSGGCSRH
jgi:cell fate (sporulation/competence/biofilm development) regulator YmcA (YheA/YmcA/DUF963 family)